jgi:hypothetical protein
MCKLVFAESELRLRRVRNGYVKKNEKVSWEAEFE